MAALENLLLLEKQEPQISAIFRGRISKCRMLLQVNPVKGDEEFVMLHPRLASVRHKVKRSSRTVIDSILSDLEDYRDDPVGYLKEIGC
jgi:hypothetical protein